MNILLLNLTRFGDLIQSQAAVNDLTAQGHKVAMVCLGNFAEAGGLIHGLSHVFPFRGAALLKTFDDTGLSAEKTWHHALADLAAWREELREEFKPDLICNLTPSLPARMLSFFLSKNAAQSGFALDERGFGINANAWAAFLQGAAISRGVSPFNIVDVFRMMAADVEYEPHVSPLPGNSSLLLPSEESRKRVASFLDNHAPSGHKGFIAFQLGASESRRRWPVTSFAALGGSVWQEEGLCPVLLGSKDEIPLAQEYGRLATHPYISLCGDTGLEDLAAALTGMRMLVTNDTGTMHLAAGLGIPVLAFFLATAQPFDTGPYLAGSCCLEPAMGCHPCAFDATCPHNQACRHHIAPDTASALVFSYLRNNHWAVATKMETIKNTARVWVSEYDNQGFMSLRSLSGHEHDARTAWLMLQRRCLHPYLMQEHTQLYIPPSFSDTPPVPSPEAMEISEALRRTASLVGLMLHQGNLLHERPLPLMRERFLGNWKKVHDCLRASHWLGSLSLLWSHETQMEGQDLGSVLERTSRFELLLASLMQGLSPDAQGLLPDAVNTAHQFDQASCFKA